jgi:transposase
MRRSVACAASLWVANRGGERAAIMYSLIVTAKMNDVDPQAWLADVLARIAEHPVCSALKNGHPPTRSP